MDKIMLYDAEGKEIEPEPEQTTALIYNEDNLKHLENVADGIERFVSAQIKIQNVILRLAKPGDWVIFGDTACISGAGTERIAAALGISFIDWKDKKEISKDEKGELYIWWHTCMVVFGNRKIEVAGRFGSRNKLLGKKDGKWRPLSEIDESDIKMASRRNAMKEGVRVILGLRNIPIEELRKAGVVLSQSTHVEYKEKKAEPPKQEKTAEDILKDIEKDSPSDLGGEKNIGVDLKDFSKCPKYPQEIRDQIALMLMEIAEQDQRRAERVLEEITTWTVPNGDNKGKVIPGKTKVSDLTEKQLYAVRTNVLKLLNQQKEGK